MPACPCSPDRAYDACCGPLHAGAPAASAEALMRSRYSAFALGLADYLLASWHLSTRPAALEPEPGMRWIGLEVRRHVATGPDTAEVEFVARGRAGGQPALRLHETSRFVRGGGHWYYLDGRFEEAGKKTARPPRDRA